MDINELSTSVGEIKSDVKDIKDKLHSIDITMVKNTTSLEQHMEQTMLLREMVLPLHEDRLKKQGKDEYIVKNQQNFFEKYKFKFALFTAAVALVTLLVKLIKGV
jgi:hypothetical protein